MLLKKLEEKAIRYNEVNELVQDPDLIKDQKRYKDVMREHSHLSALMEAYKEYKEVLQGIEDSKIIITEDEGCGCHSYRGEQSGTCCCYSKIKKSRSPLVANFCQNRMGVRHNHR